MTAMVVSDNRELVIPADQVEAMGLRPGQKVALVEVEGDYRLMRVPTPDQMRGLLPGIDTSVPDDDEEDAA